jgi:hypothetical protein
VGGVDAWLNRLSSKKPRGREQEKKQNRDCDRHKLFRLLLFLIFVPGAQSPAKSNSKAKPTPLDDSLIPVIHTSLTQALY